MCHLSWWLEPLSRSLSHHFGPVCWRFTHQVGIHHFCSRSSLIPTVLPCYRLSLDYMLARRVSHYIPLGCCSFIRLGSIASQCMLSHFFLIIWFSLKLRPHIKYEQYLIDWKTWTNHIHACCTGEASTGDVIRPGSSPKSLLCPSLSLPLSASSSLITSQICGTELVYYYHHSLSLRLHQNFLVLQ